LLHHDDVAGLPQKNVEAVIQVLEDFNISYETWDQLIMNNLLMETKMQKEYKLQVLNHNFRRGDRSRVQAPPP